MQFLKIRTNMPPKAFIIIFLLIFTAIILPLSVFAEECKGGLVPCGRNCDVAETDIDESAPCTLCHFFVLIKKIIDFLTIDIAFPLLVLMITAGGIMYLTSGGDPKRLNTAKTILKNAAIGVLIILCAWVIVDTLITFLTPADSPFQDWSTIQCPTSQ